MRSFNIFFYLSVLAIPSLLFSDDSAEAERIFRLGNSYFYGKNGYEQNYVEAFNLFEKASELGHKGALFNLGVCYDSGKGVKKNPLAAYRCYVDAAEAGIKEARFNLAICLMHGVSTSDASSLLPVDLERAERELEKLRKEGYAPALAKLAELRFSQGGDKASEVYSLLKDNVSESNPSSMRLLADCLYLGIGCEKNIPEAIKFLESASLLGDAEATAKFAHLLYCGENITKDVPRAVGLFKKLAEKGEPMALYTLGNFYLNGENMKQDIEQARRCFELSAAAGNPKAFFSLGVLAREGIGEKIDSSKAANLFLLAAGLGDAKSQYNVGIIYKNAEGVPEDYAAALFWFRKAAGQGDDRARIEIARCFLEGNRGGLVTKDEARKCLLSAAQKGKGEAIELLDKFSSTLEIVP